LRIPCPCCGERDTREFSYLGDASVRRPETASAESAGAFVDYVYLRDNRAGEHQEFWHHTAGCRSWLVVTRDTVTHEIKAARRAADRGASSTARGGNA
jgi:methylglutamate dehydrogenase subunit B